MHRSRFATLTLAALTIAALSVTPVLNAWTAPSAAPPGGNVSSPINVGSSPQLKNGTLGVNNLGVFGNTILNGVNGDNNGNGVNSYFNFGATAGQNGYGIRDNNGTLEFKSYSGSWGSLNVTLTNLMQVNGITANGLGQITSIKFGDGTTQTTAGGGSGGAVAPAFLARAAASQPLTNAVFTKLNFGTEVFDTANNFASSRFTPTVPGKYLLTATMAMDLGGLVDAIIIIYKNGTPYAWGNRIGQVSTAQYPTVSVVADANGTTDYFEVYGWQNNGGGSTVNLLGDPLRTYFSGALLPAFTGAAGVGNQWATNGSSIYYNGGNVGIGYSAPQTTLDVNGYGRFGSGGVVQGGSCSPEGALAFDISHHVPVYCSSSLVWKGYGGAGSYQLHLCYLGTFYPSGSSDCRLPNPYTGSCSCLPGYTAYHSNDFDIPLHSCPQTYYENAGMIEYSCY